jgi:hypothetical protein
MWQRYQSPHDCKRLLLIFGAKVILNFESAKYLCKKNREIIEFITFAVVKNCNFDLILRINIL